MDDFDIRMIRYGPRLIVGARIASKITDAVRSVPYLVYLLSLGWERL
jgi:hypothetical protein